MAEHTLSADHCVLTVADHGAEIRSFQVDGREYMWCGDEQYWGRVSPVLFPVVGSLKNKEYTTGGVSYPMGQHGFARDLDFTPEAQSDHSMTFVLHSDEETLKKFPFLFTLRILYEVSGKSVRVTWQVENPGEKELFFSIGAHPAFQCRAKGCAFRLYRADGSAVTEFPSEILNQDGSGTLGNGTKLQELRGCMLPITRDLFQKDALIVEHTDIQCVSLVNEKKKEYLKVDFTAPLFGLWSPAGKNAPFVCIEPWYGRCDRDSFRGSWEEREYQNRLKPGEVFERSYTITVLE